MAFPEDLTASVRAALAGAGTIREVRMFGGIGFMLDGNMVAAASKRGLLLRVGKERQAEALARPGARPMVMRGCPLEGYLYVDPPPVDHREIGDWVRLAADFVRTLPPKAPGAKRSRRKRK